MSRQDLIKRICEVKKPGRPNYSFLDRMSPTAAIMVLALIGQGIGLVVVCLTILLQMYLEG